MKPCSVPFHQENNIFQILAPKQSPALVSWLELSDSGPPFLIGRLESEKQNDQDQLGPATEPVTLALAHGCSGPKWILVTRNKGE